MSDRQDAQGKLQIILCGNQDDALVLRSAGFRSVRVVNDAEAIYVHGDGPDGFELDPTLEFFSSFILAFRPGLEDLRDALAVRLGDLRCAYIELGNERLEPKVAADLVAHAKPMWVDEVCTLSGVPEPGPQRVYLTGIRGLDDYGFRLIKPAFMTVIGPYGSGKSVLLRQLACNMFRQYGWKVLITAFEEKIKPRYVRDFRRHLIGREEMTNDGELVWRPIAQSYGWTDEQIAEADAQIEKGFRFLRRKRNSTIDADRLIDRITYAVERYGVDMVIIDPVNELDLVIPKGESKSDYMGKLIMRLKALADDYSLFMIVAAHPPKDGVEKRQSRRTLMTLNDGADTANWGNKSDYGWCVWRPFMGEDSPTYLHIDKTKDHEVMGGTTLAKLTLDQGLGRFSVSKIGYEEVLEELREDQ